MVMDGMKTVEPIATANHCSLKNGYADINNYLKS